MKGRFLRHIVLLLIVAGFGVPDLQAQIVSFSQESEVDTDSLRRAFADKQLYFGLYRDNYFIFGPPVGQKITRDNTDIKFQISIAQKLTKSTLPWGTYLYLYYTQKVFWSILQDSQPMSDINFNPGIGLAKPLFIKNRFIGKLSMQLEHESNGQDDVRSRSWERLSFSGNILVDPNFVVFGKFWIPFIDGMHNQDILKYCGIYQFGGTVMSANRKWNGTALLVKRAGWNFNYNVNLELSYRPTTKSNQYFFTQFYCGYGEGLLNFRKHTCYVRCGIVIKPTLFSEF